MPTHLKCALGHEWQPENAAAAPLVCPTCGRAASGGGVAMAAAPAADDNERTLDLPAPTPATLLSSKAIATAVTSKAPLTAPLREDVTETFTPTPQPLLSAATSTSGRTIAPVSGLTPPASAKTPPAMPFVIVRQHARGGLGVVSLARDDQIKREVALKQILPQFIDNPVLNRRFLYEAQITGQLEHPSIVPVYCLGTDDSQQPYYVMRFVKGRTLDEIIKEHHSSPNPIVLRELLRRYIAICQAVAYAHSRGVIHRDLKPANIMLGDYGETLVLDWGLAKDIKHPNNDPALWGNALPHMSTAGAPMPAAPRPGASATLAPTNTNVSELTMEGQLIGTPAYMAPEQAEGKTDQHAPTTDVYALGGILYKILTGQSPNAPSASTTGANGQRKLTFIASPPPMQVKPDVHPQLDTICARAMATDPASRYPRALELAHDIQRWLDEHPLTVPARTTSGRMLVQLRAQAPWVVLALLGIILLLVALLMRH